MDTSALRTKKSTVVWLIAIGILLVSELVLAGVVGCPSSFGVQEYEGTEVSGGALMDTGDSQEDAGEEVAGENAESAWWVLLPFIFVAVILICSIVVVALY